MDDFAVFRTAGSLLAVYPETDLARDMGDDGGGPRVRQILLAINVESPEEVDRCVAEMMAAGAALLAAPAARRVGRLHLDRRRPGRARLGDRAQPAAGRWTSAVCRPSRKTAPRLSALWERSAA